MQPDALIIQDPTLLHQVDLFNGLHNAGYILINSSRSFDALGLGEFTRDFQQSRLCTVPASELALKHVGRPLPNAALLGGFAAVTREIRLESVIDAIRGKFPAKIAAGNIAAATEAYETVARAQETAHA
jgi:pyruvate ferredoxin oxidoreductase gamma subunit